MAVGEDTDRAAAGVAGKVDVTAAVLRSRGVPFARRFRRQLLACGIVASAVTAGTDVLAGALAEGYSFTAQSISELSAARASTRSLVVPVNLTCHALMIAFGVAVWGSAGRNRALRVTAVTVIGNAALTALAELFFPMHVGEPSSSSANARNVAVMASAMVCFLLAIGSGAVAFRNWFRLYSAGTLLAYAVLTVVGLLLAPDGAGEERATVGVQERTMALGYLLWVVALAVALLRDETSAGLAGHASPRRVGGSPQA